MVSVLDAFRLDGRVALVTGGARGLGRVMAEALASAGASVVLTSRDGNTASEVARTIAAAAGSKTLGVALEVTRAKAVEEVVALTIESFGSIDILVNNAGINIRGPIEELSEAQWDEVIDTNLKGAWLCCRAVARPMKQAGWGRVINISSMLGEVSMPDRTPYSSSKGGMTMLTKTLALEWARHGICVNALCPGPFTTEINLPLLNNPEKRAAVEAKLPVGRWGEPSELGPAVVFFASEAASFITGSTLMIDGGYTSQ